MWFELHDPVHVVCLLECMCVQDRTCFIFVCFIMLLTLDIGSTARYRGPGHIHTHTRHDLRTGYPVLVREIGMDISNTRTVLVPARVFYDVR